MMAIAGKSFRWNGRRISLVYCVDGSNELILRQSVWLSETLAPQRVKRLFVCLVNEQAVCIRCRAVGTLFHQSISKAQAGLVLM